MPPMFYNVRAISSICRCRVKPFPSRYSQLRMAISFRTLHFTLRPRTQSELRLSPARFISLLFFFCLRAVMLSPPLLAPQIFLPTSERISNVRKSPFSGWNRIPLLPAGAHSLSIYAHPDKHMPWNCRTPPSLAFHEGVSFSPLNRVLHREIARPVLWRVFSFA